MEKKREKIRATGDRKKKGGFLKLKYYAIAKTRLLIKLRNQKKWD